MDRRSEILMTAGGLFKERGYHATSMRDIAKHLNVRGSSLYAHIVSKEDMLWEIVNHAADAFLLRALKVDTSLSPTQRLSALVRGHLEVIIDELPNATVFFHEWKFLSAERREAIILRRDRYEQYFREVIQAGVNAGEFSAENAKIATLYILSALNWTYGWFDDDGELTLDELSEHYLRLSLNALHKQC